MAGRPDSRTLVDRIERLIHVDVGRNITGLFDAARGALWGAASALASVPSARVGLITGFYVPQALPGGGNRWAGGCCLARKGARGGRYPVPDCDGRAVPQRLRSRARAAPGFLKCRSMSSPSVLPRPR